jgi:hypothetical protein
MAEVGARLGEHGLRIQLTQAAKEWLAGEGFDEDFGARPLKRALQRFVESPLSVRLLKGEFEKGDHILIDVAGNELSFHPAGAGRADSGGRERGDQRVAAISCGRLQWPAGPMCRRSK